MPGRPAMFTSVALRGCSGPDGAEQGQRVFWKEWISSWLGKEPGDSNEHEEM